MGRHRGLPLHRNASAPGLPRYIQVTQPWGLSGWADTGVCPYTGTRPHRGCPGTSRLRSRGDYPDGQTQGSAPTFRNAFAPGLPRYIQVTLPRRGCPGTSRLRYRVGVAQVHPGYATASGLPRFIQVTLPRRDCPGSSKLRPRWACSCNPEGNRGVRPHILDYRVRNFFSGGGGAGSGFGVSRIFPCFISYLTIYLRSISLCATKHFKKAC